MKEKIAKNYRGEIVYSQEKWDPSCKASDYFRFT